MNGPGESRFVGSWVGTDEAVGFWEITGGWFNFGRITHLPRGI